MAVSVLQEDLLLKDVFLEGWNIFKELEATSLSFNSMNFQEMVKKAIKSFEQATQLVNDIEMFSSNELIDEVSTDSLQYLLLPFFLGKLSMKLNGSNRLKVLEIAEIYFKDFLKRCQEYELCDEAKDYGLIKINKEELTDRDEFAQLQHAAQARNEKIAKFSKRKELEEYITSMKETIKNPTVEDEVKREFFLKFLSNSILDTSDELESLTLEKQMVEIKNLEIGGEMKKQSKFKEYQQPMALKPFIITRNKTQKAVFGLGYPSLPVMTVGEFYQQRVDEGIFPDAQKVEAMNQAQLLAQTEDPNQKEDQDKAVEEIIMENEDPDYLRRLRNLDEYKDVVRRGDGNRHNRS